MTKATNRGNCLSRFLRTVPTPDAFLFFIDHEQYTGEFARSMTELYRKLGEVPLESIKFHFRHGDFEEWIRKTLEDTELADSINRIEKSINGEELRGAIREKIRLRLNELCAES